MKAIIVNGDEGFEVRFYNEDELVEAYLVEEVILYSDLLRDPKVVFIQRVIRKAKDLAKRKEEI